jgi:phospholipid/cholesterol/gamma-HCH transport system substrate-binding protein
MSADRPTGGAALAKQRIGGLAFLVVLLGLVALSIAFYNKAFTEVVLVTLQTDRIGNQLTKPSRRQGPRRHRRRGAQGRGPPPTAPSSPGAAAGGGRAAPGRHPGDDPAQDAVRREVRRAHLRGRRAGVRPAWDGAVIAQDRTETARETAQALNNLLPLLQTLEPRGRQHHPERAVQSRCAAAATASAATWCWCATTWPGSTPSCPRCRTRPCRALADFADTLTAATPDLVSLLDDLSAVNRNLVRDQAAAGPLPARHHRRRRHPARVHRRERAAVHHPGPRERARTCSSTSGTARSSPACSTASCDPTSIGETFGGLQPGLHITLEFIENQGGYTPNSDEPQYLEDRGPDCFGMPNPPVPATDFNFRDGFRDELPRETTAAPEAGFAPAGFSGAESDRRIINAVVAPLLGVEADRVPDVAHLLFGPVARGTAVGLSGGSSASGSAS